MDATESEISTTGGELLAAHDHTIPRSSVISWVMYDLANTVFSMGVVSLYFPTFIRRGVGPSHADEYYGFITSISMAIIFFASPVLGAITDKARRRMPFLIVTTLLCVGFTMGMGRGPWKLSIILFVLANICYQAGLQFYDALLPDVSTEENRGKIGGIGIGIGYLGSYVALLIGYAVVYAEPSVLPALPRNPTEMAGLFTAIGVAFLLFGAPAFFLVKERGNPRPEKINARSISSSMRETIRTLRSGNEYPGLLRFLLGRMVYTDAINTVISIMFLYTVNIAVALGRTNEQGEKAGKMVMMVAISFAIAGGLLWGRLSDRLGPKRTLDRVLQCWMVIFVAAACIGVFGLPLWALFVVASAAGFCLGGVWASDRPLMLRLTPPARVGEFYGLYGMVGRFSAITGPLIWGIVVGRANAHGTPAAIGQGIGVVTLLVMILASYLILRPVSDSPREWKGTDLVR